MKVIAERDGQQLVDYGNGTGAIVDTETGLPGPVASVPSLLKVGYWTMVNDD